MNETSGLLEEGTRVLAALEAYTARTEGRLTYRREKGRNLSKEHRQQVEAVLAQVDGLRDRLRAIVAPSADAAELYRQFREIEKRIGSLSGGEA